MLSYKRVFCGEGAFVASLGIRLLLSGYQVKNFIKEVPRNNRLLELLGSIADGQPIEVRLKTILLFLTS